MPVDQAIASNSTKYSARSLMPDSSSDDELCRTPEPSASGATVGDKIDAEFKIHRDFFNENVVTYSAFKF